MIKKLGFYILSIYLSTPVLAQGFADATGDNVGNRVVFSPGLFYTQDYRKRDDSSTVTKWLTDIRLGYQWTDGWYAGIIYSYELEKVKANDYPIDDFDRDSLNTRIQYGPSGGYIYGSYYLMLNYFPVAEWEIADESETVLYKNGWGYQIDFGINFELFTHFLIGPRLSYKYFNYAKLRTDTDESNLDPHLERSVLDPYFVMWFEF